MYIKLWMVLKLNFIQILNVHIFGHFVHVGWSVFVSFLFIVY